MKNIILFIILGYLTTLGQADWTLIWSDEFNGTSIDRSKWNFEINCSGGGNNELQCYTDRTENARIENGNLVIEARREPGYNGRDYTSSRLTGFRKADWTFGKFEMRAKLPKGKHLWPAFWMMPTESAYGGWAASGEIDIMEYKGQLPREAMGSLHYSSEWPNNRYSGSGARDFGVDLSADFHVYGLEWERDRMRWYVDGQMYHERDLDRFWWEGAGRNPYTANRQPWDKPFYIILNMAVGGNFFGGMGDLTPDDVRNTWTSPRYVVDWVRVYRQCTNDCPQTQQPPTPQVTETEAPPTNGPITLIPEADAYTRGGLFRNFNFGDEPSLQVRTFGFASTYERESFLRFNLESITIPQDFRTAKLKLTVDSFDAKSNLLYTLSVGSTKCWWEESEISYSNAPSAELVNVATFTGSVTEIEFDVTRAVLKALDRDGRLSLKIYSSSVFPLMTIKNKDAEDESQRPTLTFE